MLSEALKKKFTPRAKEEAKKILQELNITKLDDDNICDVEDELTARVSSLVTEDEDMHLPIDRELLRIYDTLTDIIIDNEDDIDFLNKLILDK